MRDLPDSLSRVVRFGRSEIDREDLAAAIDGALSERRLGGTRVGTPRYPLQESATRFGRDAVPTLVQTIAGRRTTLENLGALGEAMAGSDSTRYGWTTDAEADWVATPIELDDGIPDEFGMSQRAAARLWMALSAGDRARLGEGVTLSAEAWTPQVRRALDRVLLIGESVWIWRANARLPLAIAGSATAEPVPYGSLKGGTGYRLAPDSRENAQGLLDGAAGDRRRGESLLHGRDGATRPAVRRSRRSRIR